MTSNSAETVELIERPSVPGGKWSPAEGEKALRFREHLRQLGISNSDRDNVLQEAMSVLSHCLPPTASGGRDTGLVIGYVQSGKTMSFTAISALAGDNGYKLIIVISGVTLNLFQQSTSRLKDDLGISGATDLKWQFLDNPKDRPDLRQRIDAALTSSNATPAIGSQTVLITVMKNHRHLDNLIGLLGGVHLNGKPALIIDDEADQASLNNRTKQGGESTIFRRIVELRNRLPHHTFLQYTATPQALLLINLINVLSPSFAEVLTPGPAYTGGKVFFENGLDLVLPIPDVDIPSRQNHPTAPPPSLLEAMQIYFLGVAADLAQNAGVGHRSMMIHPSKATVQHANYAHWARQIQLHWKNTLSLGMNDPDRVDLLNEFKGAYDQLTRTVQDIPPFDNLLRFLDTAVRFTIIVEVNRSRGPTPQVDWQQTRSNILVGGEVLNRGFTVEGLTVTYMPRSKGVGNADTIEQRARWFGYKAGYLGYCRVYLSDQTRRVYRSYVEHEENIRQQLGEFRASGRTLRDWRRAFFLSAELRPTRSDVLDLDYVRGNYSNAWFEQSMPHYSSDAIASNRELVRQLRDKLPFDTDSGPANRVPSQIHLVAYNVSLKQALDELLTGFRMASTTDSQRFTGLMLQVAERLETFPQDTCGIYIMSGGRPRERVVNSDDEIVQLFQGAYPVEPAEQVGTIYLGDRYIRATNGLTIQIHMLDVMKGKGGDRQALARDVATLAVWVPREMASPWVVQDQGGP